MTMEIATAEPFRIHVDQETLDDLAQRLRRTRWTATRGDDWDRGTERSFLRHLVSYWSTHYDWRVREDHLNRLPQFKAAIGDTAIHFVHTAARGGRPIPLLLLHGWPDSFFKFHRVIPKLGDPGGAFGEPVDSFDVVVPSLPGFGFSGVVPRFGGERPLRRVADRLFRLMTEVLGYERFVVAGGDCGGALAQILAIEHPEAILGVHLTDLGWHVSNVDPATVSKSERKYLEAMKKRSTTDGAYALVQSTEPESLAAGLDDSPVGLLSWIVDRFRAWTDHDGEAALGEITPDDLLTNVMLYWVTRTIGSSMYGYYAEARSPSITPADRVERPVGLALFPKDVGGIPPRPFAERTLNVVRWTEMPRGGHFAALEEPDLYGRDLVDFCRPFRALRMPTTEEASHVARNV